jgi:outer membrane immunogenic protein
MTISIRKTLAAATLLALAAAASAAGAADLQTQTYVPAPVMAPVSAYNWTGFYLGLNAGYGFGQQTPLSLIGDNYSGFNYSANGFLGGVTAGAQIQAGRVVMGLETDLDWTNTRGSGSGPISVMGTAIGTATLASTLSSMTTLRARIGYAADNWLFYGTGGAAVTNEAWTITSSSGFVCGTAGPNFLPCASRSDLHLGLAAGGGVEYGITPNMSAKLEYIWIGAGATNTLKENTVKAGLNLRFGGL